MSEKQERKFDRHPIELAASCGNDADTPEMHEADVLNASLGGFCIQSRKKLDGNSPVTVEVEGSDEKNAAVQCKIVWQKKNEEGDTYTVGLQLNPSTADYARYHKILKDQILRPRITQ